MDARRELTKALTQFITLALDPAATPAQKEEAGHAILEAIHKDIQMEARRGKRGRI